MGGRKIVYVRIVVAAIFDFMLPLTRPTSFSLLEFQHCAFASKNIRAPEDYITLRLNDFFFFLGGGGEGRGKGLRSYYDGKKLTQSYCLLLSRYVTISWIFFS